MPLASEEGDAAGCSWALGEDGDGVVLGHRCTPLSQPGRGELSTGQLSPRPQLSAGCFGRTQVCREHHPNLAKTPSLCGWGLFIAKVPIAYSFPMGVSNLADPRAGKGPGECSPAWDGASTGTISILCGPGDVTQQ